MCNKLNKIIAEMEETDEPMTKRETLTILKACGEDMEKHTKKIESLENKVEEIQEIQKTILNMQNSMFDMLKTSLEQQKEIQSKLARDKISEKAYMNDKLLAVLKSKIFWVVVLVLVMFSGIGFYKSLDKADNVAKIMDAIKK